jgi:hypothetical protein
VTEVWREIVREKSFEDAAKAAFGSIALVEHFLLVVEWALACEPSLDVFPVVRTTRKGDVRAMTTDATPRTPAMLVLFREARDGRVHLLSVGHAKPGYAN